jgi:hypothetical protein
MLLDSIYTKLSATGAATAAILGTLVAARLYPTQAPVGALTPYAVMTEVSGVPNPTLGEASASASQLIQFSCVASTARGARLIAQAIVSDLDNVTLAGGEVCLSCSTQQGYSEATDQFLTIVEARYFVPAGI